MKKLSELTEKLIINKNININKPKNVLSYEDIIDYICEMTDMFDYKPLIEQRFCRILKTNMKPAAKSDVSIKNDYEYICIPENNCTDFISRSSYDNIMWIAPKVADNTVNAGEDNFIVIPFNQSVVYFQCMQTDSHCKNFNNLIIVYSKYNNIKDIFIIKKI